MGRSRVLLIVVVALVLGCSRVREEFTFIVDRSMFESPDTQVIDGVEVSFSGNQGQRFFPWTPADADTLPIRVLGAGSAMVSVIAVAADSTRIGGSLPDREVQDGSRVCLYSERQLSSCPLDGSGGCDCSPMDATVTRDATSVRDAAVDAAITTVEVSIATGTDDAMQNPAANGGTVLTDHNWISLYSPDHWGALRFELPAIWSGATILQANLTLYADSAEESTPNFRIHAQSTLPAEPFAPKAYSISMRERSDEFVTWVSNSPLGPGRHQSPGLESLLQAVISDPDWNSSKSVVLILDTLKDTNDTEVCDNCSEFRTYEYPPGDGTYAAKLEVSFTPPQ